MNMRILVAAAVVSLLSACGTKTATTQSEYTLNVTLNDNSADSTMAYVLNFDNGEKIDSAVVADGAVSFNGTLEAPKVVRLIVNGRRAGLFILDEGVTEVKDKKASGALNEAYETTMKNYYAMGDSIFQSVDSTYTQAALDSVLPLKREEIANALDAIILANADNVIGYRILAEQGMTMKSERFQNIVSKHPSLLDYKRINSLKNSFDAYDNTSAGKPYVDFSIEYEGNTTSLSDFVKPGEYTLVDFWASWCGPCKREIEVVKDLYAKYGGKGLNVVGVTVWEDPADTKAYLADNPLPWDIMLNGQTEPTELYGINGIPCILLIDPQGTIVARNLFDSTLINAVEEAMNPAK